MAPRKIPSKMASADKSEADSPISATNTPKRMMKNYRIRDRSTTPSNAKSSPDELDTPSGTHHTKQPGPDEEALDEIVVSKTPRSKDAQATDSNGDTARGNNMTETPRALRRSSRVSSISIRGSPAAPPSDKSVTRKKQEFGLVTSGSDDGKPDELELPTPSKRRKANPDPKPRVAPRKSRSKWDNPDEMLTNPNSPLVKAKLRELLCSPMAWESLSAEEKEQIVSKFPDASMILNPDTPDARPNIVALLNNNNFRNDVTRYQEGLGRGYHDPEWIQQAQSAHRAREAGVYDDFMASDFEEKWGVPLPNQAQPEAQPESGMSGSNGRQADNASEGQANGASIESEAAASEEVATKHQGENRTSNAISTDMPREKSVDTSMHGQIGDVEDINGHRVAPANNGASVDEKEQPNEVGGKQLEPVTAEDVTMPDSTESATQTLSDPIPDTDSSAMPSLPEEMKGVEGQSTEKQRENPEIKQVDTQDAPDARDTGAVKDETTQAVVTTNGT
ncbi:Asx homology domain-containing protein [Xylaria sp. FL0064]|nr:Asx homology domain-containing protein [Xylaria sp. FL0064]